MTPNLLLLALCQAMLMSGASLMITTAAVVGDRLSSDPQWATLPLGLQFLATLATTIPASLLMQRIGRRRGFLIGAVSGLAGAGLAAFAVYRGDFVLFCVAALPIGVFNGFGQYYRFAAVEAAPEAFHSRAISWVLAGGLIAAFLGPNLANWSSDWLEVPYAGSFLGQIGLYLVALLALLGLRLPAPARNTTGSGRPLAEIARQPAFMVAVLNAMVAYGVMSLLMTATPLAMKAHHHPFEDAAFVIQWHLLGMFAPSFFTGSLIRRFGLIPMMVTGLTLLLAAVLAGLSGTGLMAFWTSLVALGLGWNFLFVAATDLLTRSYQPSERAKAQAFNDFLMVGCVALASFSAGALQHRLGWAAVNLGVLPLLLVSLLATLWLGWRQGRAAPQPAG